MKVTTKGQVTIPARIRDFLGISPHIHVDFRISGEQVVLVKQAPRKDAGGRVASLRGILKGKRTTRQWMLETRGD